VRIVHIDTGPEMQGGQYQVLLLLSGLRERGCSQILLAKKGGPLWRAAEMAGYQVSPATFLEVWRRSALADTVVHAHDARAHTLAAVASRAEIVVSRRVAFPVKQSFVSRWKYRRASRYLAVSHFVCEMLIAAGVSREKIDVVYDGVEETPAGAPWNPALPIVTLASLDPGKNRALVQQAAALAGVDVIYSDDLVRDLRRASLFVYLTRAEGLGSAALLAMSMGVPVIASRVGGLAEVFVHNESGLYVQNEVQEVAAMIRHLRNHPELAWHIGQGGRQRIQECFTKEHMINNTLRAYGRVLAR
jgi:Glycosyl transferases group 1/Glycosyltransferase Family 4